MKTKQPLVPFNDPAQVSLAFYSIRTSIERQTKALEAQASALVKAIREQTSVLEDLGDVLRATNEILIQRHLSDKAGKDLARVREQIETAKKTLLRQGLSPRSK